jgi:hypothetical protein
MNWFRQKKRAHDSKNQDASEGPSQGFNFVSNGSKLVLKCSKVGLRTLHVQPHGVQPYIADQHGFVC